MTATKTAMIPPAAAAAVVVAATDRHFRLTLADGLIIAIGLLFTFLAAWLVYTGPAPARLIIQANNQNYVYPLDTDKTLRVSGNLGETSIEIRNGRVRISDSPCRNKTCIASGWLQGTGSWSACLPNGVFLRIEGEEKHEPELDAVVY